MFSKCYRVNKVVSGLSVFVAMSQYDLFQPLDFMTQSQFIIRSPWWTFLAHKYDGCGSLTSIEYIPTFKRCVRLAKSIQDSEYLAGLFTLVC